MPNQPAPETELLRAAYAAFNARDIDAALALMTPEVEWPRAFKGGFVRGPEAIRAYWTEQWSEEAATGIFLWPAWGLYDTIKGDKFKHIDFSHD
jgi:hypothetical protein